MRKRLKKKLNRKGRLTFNLHKAHKIADLVIQRVTMEMEVKLRTITPLAAIPIIAQLSIQIAQVNAKPFKLIY